MSFPASRRFAGATLTVCTLFCALVAPAAAQPAQSLTDHVASGQTLRRGADNATVRDLQTRLAALGFTLGVDGDFGRTTERTVKAFQSMRGLTADGIVGRSSLAALDDAAAHPTLRRGAEGETVKELQRLLNHADQRLTVDGDYGPGTERAVRSYQASQTGLSATGVADAATLARLRQAAARANSLLEGIGGVTPTTPTTPTNPGARTDRPTARSNQSEAYAKGLTWARQAQAAGRHTLIINFEGWISFSQSFADKVYDYHRDLRAGRRASAPRVGSMSFMAKRLIGPNLARHHAAVELLLLPETSENGSTSVAEATARAWHQVHGARLKLIVTGHSFGGNAALRLARKLERREIPIAGMLTVDARTAGSYRTFVRPTNVRRHFNDFHKGLVMPGYEIQGATNLRIRGVTHGSIVGHRSVRDHYRQLVER